MSYRIALAALAALVTSSIASTAAAQQVPCGPSEALTARLASEYGEAVTGGGIDAAGRVLQIFANAETGTWTAVVSTAEGMSCVVSSGELWASERPDPAVKGRQS